MAIPPARIVTSLYYRLSLVLGTMRPSCAFWSFAPMAPDSVLNQHILANLRITYIQFIKIITCYIFERKTAKSVCCHASMTQLNRHLTKMEFVIALFYSAIDTHTAHYHLRSWASNPSIHFLQLSEPWITFGGCQTLIPGVKDSIVQKYQRSLLGERRESLCFVLLINRPCRKLLLIL